MNIPAIIVACVAISCAAAYGIAQRFFEPKPKVEHHATTSWGPYVITRYYRGLRPNTTWIEPKAFEYETDAFADFMTYGFHGSTYVEITDGSGKSLYSESLTKRNQIN